MLHDVSQARTLLEAEGWQFEIATHPGTLAEVELVATHSGLGIRSVTLAASESEAWDLLVASGGP